MRFAFTLIFLYNLKIEKFILIIFLYIFIINKYLLKMNNLVIVLSAPSTPTDQKIETKIPDAPKKDIKLRLVKRKIMFDFNEVINDNNQPNNN